MTTKRPAILDRETTRTLKLHGGGWTIGPDTQGQASFRPSTNSRKAIDRAGINLDTCDTIIVTGARRRHARKAQKPDFVATCSKSKQPAAHHILTATWNIDL